MKKRLDRIGRYELIDRLDEGAMGEVYRAHDPELNRKVAIKVVKLPGMSDREKWRQRFQREVQAASKLNHRHIITIYDVAFNHNPPYVVMELLSGGSLKARLQSRRLSWLEALKLLRPLVEALAYAHQQGIIHRDVKPANIMFGDDNVLKLVDFGLARQQDVPNITQTGQILGTPAYMSPEQARGYTVNIQTDIFALGIILFETITGYNPIDKGTLMRTLEELWIIDRPIDTSPLIGQVPPTVIRLIERAIAKQRDRRYTSCEQLLADLDYCLDDLTDPSIFTTVISPFKVGSNRPDQRLIIQKATGIQISPEEEGVLRRMFSNYSELDIGAEFKSGLSRSRVLRVQPIEVGGRAVLPAAVKIAPVDLIQQEWHAYRTLVKDTLPKIAQIEAPPTEPVAGFSGLRYTLIGSGVLDMQSLHVYSRTVGPEKLCSVLEDQLFKIIGDSWWLNNQGRHSFQMRSDYDWLLPVNLLLSYDNSSQTSPATLIEPHRYPSPAPVAGTSVRIQGFIVTEREPYLDKPGYGQLVLNLPQDLIESYRLRMIDVPDISRYQIGSLINAICGAVKQTRQELLREQAQQVLPKNFDLLQETISLAGGLELPNPLLAYETRLNEFLMVKLSTIHGDLNLENILVAPTTGEVNLIDFVTVRRGHALHDLLRLETEVVTKLIPEVLHETELPAEAILPLYQRLHQAIHYPDWPLMPDLPADGLEKPFTMLLTIREMAKKCFYNPDDWTEYYYGLLIYLLGALKFKNLDTIPLAKRTAFLGAAATAQLLREGTLDSGTSLHDLPIPACPYRGLEFFNMKHTHLFFGRDTLVATLLEKLLPQSQGMRFLAVIGPSGSGKSSLVRAGLIAKLKQGIFEDSENWPVVICRPLTNPLDSLVVSLSDVIGLGQDPSKARQLAEDFHQDKGMLDLTVNLALRDAPSPRRLVLLMDQFEEVFTLCKDESVRRAMLDNLLYAAKVPDGRTIVLITMRADFYGKCAAYPELAEMISNHQELVSPMTKAELEQAIVQPAQQVKYQFETGLVAQLLREVQDQPGALPLLQYALKELWARQEGRRLTWKAYNAIGGVAGALEGRADDVYNHFSDIKQQICQQIFLRLTQPGEGTEDTKRRVSWQELLPAGVDPTSVNEVIADLAGAKARLITTRGQEKARPGQEEAKEGQFVEVAHEALIKGWGRLRGWLEANRDALRTHRRLTEAANEWKDDKGRDEGYLYRGALLATAEEWAKTHAETLNTLEQEFLAASVALRDRIEQEREAQRQWELKAAQGLAEEQRRRAEAERQRAEEQNRRAEAERQRAEEQHHRAEAERQRAEEQNRRAEVERQRAEEQTQAAARLRKRAMLLAGVVVIALVAAITAGVLGVQARQNAAEARQNAAEARQNAAEARQNAAEANSRALAAAAISNLPVDPELSILLARQAVDTTETIETIQALHQAVQTSRVRQTFEYTPSRVVSVAFSPDGSRLATANYDDKTVTVWSVGSDEPSRTFKDQDPQAGRIWSVAFSPDGVRLATAGENQTIKVWNSQSGELLLTLKGHTDTVSDVAFSPDGLRLASASFDKTAKIWQLSAGSSEDRLDGQEMETLEGHTGGITSLAFSLDSQHLATASEDKTAKIWDIASGTVLKTLEGHTNVLHGITFSQDGACLATASEDGTARVWDISAVLNPGITTSLDPCLSGDGASLVFPGHTNFVWGVAFSPDGRRLATAGADGTAKVWSILSGKLLLTLAGHRQTIRDVTFSSDGTRLATASEDKTAKIWDVSGHSDEANDVAFSPTEPYLVTVSRDGTAKIWQVGPGGAGNAATVQELFTYPVHPAAVRRVAFSPDGSRLATASQDHTVKLWQVITSNPEGQITLEEEMTLSGHTNWVQSVAFSPECASPPEGCENWLATASKDRTAKLWNVTTGEMLNFEGHNDEVNDVVFSPDGDFLATASFDTTAKVWDVTSGKALASLDHSEIIGGVAFSPDGTHLATAGVRGIAQIWPLEISADGTMISAQEPLTLTGHTNWVRDVTFSPDGHRVATASYDNTAKIWEASSGEVLLTLNHAVGVNSVAFSPDGQSLATTTVDGALHLYILDDIDALMDLAQARLTRP